MLPLAIDPGFELVLASQGMSKGLRQTDGVQGLVRAEIDAGFLFVAAAFKNVTSPTASGESNLQIGARHSFAGFEMSAAIAYKRNTGAGLQSDRDAVEFVATATRTIGSFTPRLSLIYSGDELGTTRASVFAEVGAGMRIRPGLAASANIGRRQRDGGFDYTAFNFGLSYDLHRLFSADVRYFDTSRSALGEIYRPRIVASLRARF